MTKKTRVIRFQSDHEPQPHIYLNLGIWHDILVINKKDFISFKSIVKGLVRGQHHQRAKVRFAVPGSPGTAIPLRRARRSTRRGRKVEEKGCVIVSLQDYASYIYIVMATPPHYKEITLSA
jgi:hypothetical protein